jgi:hypothetical protein
MRKSTTRVRALSLSVLLISVCDAGYAHAKEGDTPAAEGVLKMKGLTRVRAKYHLDEAYALSKYAEADSAHTAFREAEARRNAMLENDEAIRDLERSLASSQGLNNDLQVQMDALRAKNAYRRIIRWNSVDRIAYQQLDGQSREVRSRIGKVKSELGERRSRQPRPRERQAIQAEFDRSRKVCLDRLGELGDAMDPIMQKYRELAADGDVKAALAALNRPTQGSLKVAPSDRFIDADEQLRKMKFSVSPQRNSATKKKDASSRRR